MSGFAYYFMLHSVMGGYDEFLVAAKHFQILKGCIPGYDAAQLAH
jgi:hypothetical protein